jgi:hypothetical protein
MLLIVHAKCNEKYLQIVALDNLNADEEFKNIVENDKVHIPFLY